MMAGVIAAAGGSHLSYQQTVLNLSPLMFWPLDDASGTTATDVSGNGRHGTYRAGTALNQPSMMGSGVGAAIATTENSGQGVGITDAAWMDTNYISAVIRVKTTSAVDGTNGDGLFSRYTFSDAGLASPWLLRRNPSGYWEALLRNSSDVSASASSLASGLIPGNSNTTVGFTFDGSNVKLYVDGVNTATTALTGVLKASASDIEIGRWAKDAITTGEAKYQGAALWDTALSGADMADIHAAAIST